MKSIAQPTGGMVKQLMTIQSKMNKAQEELAKASYTAEAANGLVDVVVLGTGEIKSINIKPELMGEEPDVLGDIIATALNRAFSEKEAATKKALQDIGAGVLPMGLKIPGLG